MKNPVPALILTFVVVVALLFTLFFFFTTNWSSQTLAAFGSYIGGVMTPLTVLVALVTLIRQQRTHDDEMERLLAQSYKTDLLRFIEKIEKDIESTLNGLSITVQSSDRRIQHQASDAIFKISMQEWDRIIPSESDILKRMDSSERGIHRYDDQLLSYEVFGMVAAHIKRLREYCEEFGSVKNQRVLV